MLSIVNRVQVCLLLGKTDNNPDSKVHVANMGPTWVLSAPGGPHVGHVNLAIWDIVWEL